MVMNSTKAVAVIIQAVLPPDNLVASCAQAFSGKISNSPAIANTMDLLSLRCGIPHLLHFYGTGTCIPAAAGDDQFIAHNPFIIKRSG